MLELFRRVSIWFSARSRLREMQIGATRLPGAPCALYVSAFGRDISLRSPLLVRSGKEMILFWSFHKAAMISRPPDVTLTICLCDQFFGFAIQGHSKKASRIWCPLDVTLTICLCERCFSFSIQLCWRATARRGVIRCSIKKKKKEEEDFFVGLPFGSFFWSTRSASFELNSRPKCCIEKETTSCSLVTSSYILQIVSHYKIL